MGLRSPFLYLEVLMASKVDLISNALILIGDKPINSLTDPGFANTVGANLYNNIALTELSKFRWSFAQRKQVIALTTDTPLDQEWQYIYQLPTDLISIYKVYPNARYNIYGDKLHTNSKLTSIEYTANVPESEWPPYFAKMMEYALAKDFATAIRDSSTARQEMQREYVNQSRMARATDAQGRSTVAIQSSPFTEVR